MDKFVEMWWVEYVGWKLMTNWSYKRNCNPSRVCLQIIHIAYILLCNKKGRTRLHCIDGGMNIKKAHPYLKIVHIIFSLSLTPHVFRRLNYYIIENNPPTYLSKVLVLNFVIIYFVTLDNSLSAYLFLTASWRWNSFKERL